MEVAAPLWELGLVPALSHLELPGQHLMRAVFSRRASWLVCYKSEIVSGCLGEGEKVGECTGQWSTCTTSRASKSPLAHSSNMQQKNRISGGFPHGSAFPCDSLGVLGVLKTLWILARPLWKGLTSCSILLSHSTRVGAWGRDSRPTAFLKQGKSFPTPLRGAEGEADKEGSLN